MDILKTAIEWAKAEVFSAQFFVLFGIVFLCAALGFWQLGKTEVARAFIFPNLTAGILLLIVGLGLFFTNKSRLSHFSTDYERDTSAFIASEIERAEKSIQEYQSIVFRIIPLIIIIAALLIIFVDQPLWRAIAITTIAMMIVILFVDSNANARISNYKTQLEKVAQ